MGFLDFIKKQGKKAGENIKKTGSEAYSQYKKYEAEAPMRRKMQIQRLRDEAEIARLKAKKAKYINKGSPMQSKPVDISKFI